MKSTGFAVLLKYLPTSLLILAIGLSHQNARAQSIGARYIDSDGRSQIMSLQDFQVRVADGTLWSHPLFVDGANCEGARRIVERSRIEPGDYPPKRRVEAAEQYLACLERARFRFMAGAQDNPPAMSAATARATDDLIASATAAEVRVAQHVSVQGQSTDKWLGLGFALGFGVSYSSRVVSQADVAKDGTVRTLKSEQARARAILEAHYLFGDSEPARAGRWSHGPFFGIVADQQDGVSGFALGWTIGIKRTDPTKADGFGIGLGVVLDNEVRRLARGFQVGQPLPPSETDPVFETKERWSGLLFLTKTF